MNLSNAVKKFAIVATLGMAIIPITTASAEKSSAPPQVGQSDADFNSMIMQPGYNPAGYNYPMGSVTPVENDIGDNGTSEPMQVTYVDSYSTPPSVSTTETGWQYKGEDSIVESENEANRTGKNMYSYGGSIKFEFWNMTAYNSGTIEVWEDDGDGQTNDDYHGYIEVNAGSNGRSQDIHINVDSWAESESDGRAEIYLEFNSEDINGDWWTYAMYD